MAFSEVWDNTQPADTQAANLLGSDIRNLKLDIQQRMSAISGLDAAKQNFEAGFAGVLYFATDTGNVYQWNGAAWQQVLVGGSWSDFNNVTPVTLGSGVAGNGVVVPVPPNAIQIGSYFEVRAGIRTGLNGGVADVTLTVGTANGVFSFNLTHQGTCTIKAYGIATAPNICTVYYEAVIQDTTSSRVLVGAVTGAVTGFAAGFPIKTTCDSGMSGIGGSVTFDFVCVRVKK